MHTSVESFKNSWVCFFFPLPVMLYFCHVILQPWLLPTSPSSSLDGFSCHSPVQGHGEPREALALQQQQHCSIAGLWEVAPTALRHQAGTCRCTGGSSGSWAACQVLASPQDWVGISRTVTRRICVVAGREIYILVLTVLAWSMRGRVAACSCTECVFHTIIHEYVFPGMCSAWLLEWCSA